MTDTEYAFEEFKEVMWEHRLAYRALISVCNRQLDEVSRIKELEKGDSAYRVEHYSYFDSFYEEKVALRSDRIPVKNAFNFVLNQQNGQICGLLADSYEAFEAFLKRINGSQDGRKLSQLLSFSGELGTKVNKSLNHCLPGSVIRVRTALQAIDIMRQSIVHYRSIIDITIASDKVFRRSGSKNKTAEIEGYFRLYTREERIWLIETSVSSKPFRVSYRQPYNELTDLLISVAAMIHRENSK